MKAKKPISPLIFSDNFVSNVYKRYHFATSLANHLLKAAHLVDEDGPPGDLPANELRVLAVKAANRDSNLAFHQGQRGCNEIFKYAFLKLQERASVTR